MLPEAAKAAGIGQRLGGTPKAMSDGESGESLIPGSRFVDLKAGQAVLWTGDMLHRGRTPAGRERLTLSCSWSRWNGIVSVHIFDRLIRQSSANLALRYAMHNLHIARCSAGINAPLPDYRDRTMLWKLDPAVREALPTEWMKTSWDRWLLTQNTTSERFMGPNPNFKEKVGEQKLQGLGKGSMIDGVGDGVSTEELLEAQAAAAERVRSVELDLAAAPAADDA